MSKKDMPKNLTTLEISIYMALTLSDLTRDEIQISIDRIRDACLAIKQVDINPVDDDTKTEEVTENA